MGLQITQTFGVIDMTSLSHNELNCFSEWTLWKYFVDIHNQD